MNIYTVYIPYIYITIKFRMLDTSQRTERN